MIAVSTSSISFEVTKVGVFCASSFMRRLTVTHSVCLNPSDHEGVGRGRQPVKKSAKVRETGPEWGKQAFIKPALLTYNCSIPDKMNNYGLFSTSISSLCCRRWRSKLLERDRDLWRLILPGLRPFSTTTAAWPWRTIWQLYSLIPLR